MYTNVKSGLTAEIINEFKAIVGENFVLYNEEALNHYAHDETENLHYLPDVVIKPRTTQEIMQ
jgi:glycolate oxidase